MFVRTASSPTSAVSLVAHVMAAFVAVTMAVVATTAPASANSRYAAYVIDASTGQVLFSRNADSRRYPASLTKMMTLYLVFEAMASGRINKNSPIPISKNAAAEVPTKLGVPAGQSVPVDIAIKALVTRSANDVSTAIAEMLGGSEAGFARMMTSKARQLGMNSTQFRNAHGLPNSEQYTTARDMAILGIALREHFPSYYDYFSTRSFQYGKQTVTTHNRMFGRYKGVDGIKTGYINASGFNLVTSVKDGGRNVVAVVMGGESARSRDNHMVELLNSYVPKASRSGGAPLIASRKLTPGTPVAVASVQALPSTNIPMPDFRPAGEVEIAAYAPEPAAAAIVPPMPVAAAAETQPMVDPVKTASLRPDSGWIVQVASSPSESEARDALTRAGAKASGILASASPFTEVFNNKGTTYHRARFGGFASKTAAWNACNALRKKGIDCYAAEL